MPDEVVDIYDENMTRTGTALKSEAHRKGLWHRAIHCWVVRGPSPGAVLFQKRGRSKAVYPNALDISAAGHYRAGETAREGVRELIEELGLAVPVEQLTPLGVKIDVGVFQEHVVHEFCDVFLLRDDRAPRGYAPDPDEVDGLVGVGVPDGLALFSGERSEASAQGIEYDHASREWGAIRLSIDRGSVIPRVDPYYYKVMILAERFLRGEKHLAI